MPKRMFDHFCDTILGVRAPHQVSVSRPIKAADLALVTGGVVHCGRIVTQDGAGNWQVGASDQKPPFVLLNNSDDLDVVNDGGDPTTDPRATVSVTPPKKLLAVLVNASSCFESTEFDTTKTYTEGQALAAPRVTDDGDTFLDECGVLTNDCTLYTDDIVGFVLEGRGPSSAKNRMTYRPTLRWIGHFIPNNV